VTESATGPVFTGMVVHRDLKYRYSFLLAEGWYDYELESEGGRGRIFTPYPDDVVTSFSVEARDLGMKVSEEDLSVLRDGLENGLHQLPDLTIEKHEDYAIGDLIGLEYWFTFRDAESDTIRKRWLRLVYQGQIQVRLIAQGASPEQFEYWLPMFFQAMRTFQFADWWAQISGHSWQHSLKGDFPGEE
jgi:hypothetical protein